MCVGEEEDRFLLDVLLYAFESFFHFGLPFMIKSLE